MADLFDALLKRQKDFTYGDLVYDKTNDKRAIIRDDYCPGYHWVSYENESWFTMITVADMFISLRLKALVDLEYYDNDTYLMTRNVMLFHAMSDERIDPIEFKGHRLPDNADIDFDSGIWKLRQLFVPTTSED